FIVRLGILLFASSHVFLVFCSVFTGSYHVHYVYLYISLILQDPQVVDSGSKGWTDEKHTLFLNSIEASFVNELYNEQYHSKAVQGWLSRTKEHKGSTEPSMKYGQFKVLRKGCWRNLRFEMDNNHAEIENGSFPLCTNPWIQHFRSPYILKEKHLKSSDRDDDIEFKHICHQDSIDSSTEVSDQNFIADELIVGQRSSRICRKRRRGTALVHEPINDQLIGVHFVQSTCYHNL
ncbi:hypothetical protein BHE74_00033025, partial [Ensete ventricosum]